MSQLKKFREGTQFCEALAAYYRPPEGQFFSDELIQAATDAMQTPDETIVAAFVGNVLEHDPETQDYLGKNPIQTESITIRNPQRGLAWVRDREAPMAWGTYQEWIKSVLKDKDRTTVPITFIYYRCTSLMISIQQRSDGAYYDFATKLFSASPLTPRAALTQLGDIGPFSFLYGAAIGRSGRLHGDYVVTVRDMDYRGDIVAIMAYAIENNQLTQALGTGALNRYEVEKGLPAPFGMGATGTLRSGRVVELD